MPKLYLLHPIAVHFPIALLVAGLISCWMSIIKKGPGWLSEVSSWLLWLGTAAAWIAMLLGLLAEKTVPHVPAAWKELNEHETLAFWTVGLFTCLSLWRLWAGKKRQWFFLVCWLISAGVLISTGFHGGELVFSYGLGVSTD